MRLTHTHHADTHTLVDRDSHHGWLLAYSETDRVFVCVQTWRDLTDVCVFSLVCAPLTSSLLGSDYGMDGCLVLRVPVSCAAEWMGGWTAGQGVLVCVCVVWGVGWCVGASQPQPTQPAESVARSPVAI